MKAVLAAVATLFVLVLAVLAMPAADGDIAFAGVSAVAMLAVAGGVFALAAHSRNQVH
jgi:hypothetical protein